MKEISLRDLLEAGCHFGHQTTRWHPKMRPYIFTARDGIHIFDLVKTKKGLEEAAEFARVTASQGGQIIFVGTKRQAKDIVKEAAQKAGMPYITERWIGGLITNWDALKRRLNYFTDLKAKKAEGNIKDRTKKENLLIDKEIIKLEKDFGGVASLKDIPAAIFVVDGRKESLALKEAVLRNVKTIAIVDTNVDPDNVNFVVPANDDATKSIQLICDAIVEAIEEGRKTIGVKKAEKTEKSETVQEEKTEKKEVSIKKKVIKKEKKAKAEEKPKEVAKEIVENKGEQK